VKLGLLSDLHFRGKDYEEQSSALHLALGQMESRGVSWILCAGDVWDRPQIMDRRASVGTLVRSFLSPIEYFGIPAIIVGGNHDRLLTANHTSSAEVFHSHPLIRVITDRPEHFVIQGEGRDAYVACYPWLLKSDAPEGQSLKEWCKSELELTTSKFASKPDHYKVFLSHCELEGAYSPYGFVLPGSTYCFTEAELEATGADLIALGHVHNRQSYYIGALIQLSYGEEGNPTGWLLADTVTETKQYIKLEKPRKYFTIREGNLFKSPRSHDKVKLIGKKPPKDLPPGTIFEYEPDSKITQPRPGEGNISSGDPVKKLLEVWADANGVELTTKHYEILGNVAEHTEKSVESEGSLEFVERVHLNNIGPHVNTVLDFDPAENWWAISGRNGGGKTIVLEATLAALYGKFAQPGRTLAATLTGPKGFVEVIFQAKGKRWKVRRDLKASKAGKKVSISATFSQIGSNKRTVEGSRPVLEEVTNLCGSYDMLIGSAFLTQSGTQDLVSLEESKRMAFVRKFLGLSRFDAMVKLAKEEMAIEARKRDALSRHLERNDLESVLSRAEVDLKECYEAKDIEESDLVQLYHLRDVKREESESLRETISTEIQDTINRTHKNETRYRTLQRSIENIHFQNQKALEHVQRLKSDATGKILRIVQEEEQITSAGCASKGFLPCPFIDAIRGRVEQLPKLNSFVDEQQQVINKRLWEADNVEYLEQLNAEKDMLDEQMSEDRHILSDHHKVTANDPKVVLMQELSEIDRKISSKASQALPFLAREIGRLEQTVKQAKENIKRREKIVEELNSVTQEILVFEDIMRALGKGGIPQLLISAMAPQLQKTLDQVCQEDFKNRFTLRIDTLRDLQKDDEKKETFTILFCKGPHEYDVRSCSGGEEAAVRAAVRTALIVFQAESTSKGYKVCFLDEPTAHQDSENAEATLKMIERLRDRFRQILFVSHQDDLLAGFPNHIKIG
jgi:DNA repair exonuclease SbcCD ATPase subunit/DNA repair exonuclease SbcCD nuclease subunit